MAGPSLSREQRVQPRHPPCVPAAGDPDAVDRCYADDPSNAWATGVVSTQGEPYWSSTSDQPPTYACTAYPSLGYLSSDLKAVYELWVWPVRDGQ